MGLSIKSNHVYELLEIEPVLKTTKMGGYRINILRVGVCLYVTRSQER